MGDPIKVECGQCGKTLKCPAEMAGRTGKCPGCGAAIEVTSPSQVSAVSGSPSSAPVHWLNRRMPRLSLVVNFLLLMVIVVPVVIVALSDRSENEDSAPLHTPKLEDVVCNRFEIVVKLVPAGDADGGIPALSLAVDTDIRPDASVMVSVSRTYVGKEDGKTYSLDYYNEKSRVYRWREAQQVKLDDAKLVESYEKGLLLGYRQPMKPGSLSAEVNVSVVLPCMQSGPGLDRWGERLKGKAVPRSGNKAIRREARIAVPMSMAFKPRVLVRPGELGVGKTYRLSRRTPLVPLDAGGTRRGSAASIPERGTITVYLSEDRNGRKWYRVEAFSSIGRSIGSGWVNSLALEGQEIERVAK